MLCNLADRNKETDLKYQTSNIFGKDFDRII